MDNTKKLWGGLHQASPDKLMQEFATGRDVTAIPASDEKLIPYDIRLNIAHVEMLAEVGLLSMVEKELLVTELKNLMRLWKNGEFKLQPELEDVHTNIEYYLTEKLGKDTAGKLHTGRSRNDQVTTDMYLYLHDQFGQIVDSLENLSSTLFTQANKYKDVVCPGYTHYQPATVTSFGNILEGFAVGIERDIAAVKNTLVQFNFSPLGAATGYGTTVPIKPNMSAKILGFQKVFINSIDTITNRGEFETRLAADASVLLNHFSQMAQTLIIFSSKEYGFINLPDEYTTGSSIMPQKRNPDFLELVKAKASVVQGLTIALMGISKSAYIGYNRDTQETKHLIMDVVENTRLIAPIMTDLVGKLVVDKEKMKQAANSNFVNSTQVMEALIVSKKLPMREAKKLIEKAIKYSIESGNKNKIKYKAFEKALLEMDIKIKITEKELELWQRI